MWIGIIITAVIVVILASWFSPAPLKHPGSQTINVLEQVELGGVKQWISIRGTDQNKPVLLFLHGGPGSANLSKLRNQCPELEDHFVVVNWDQRGAGKSFIPWSDSGSLTLKQLRQDTHELVSYLRKRFEGRKIYLMGFSWGTVLGLWTAHDYPDDFYAFIGASQEVDYQEGEKRSLVYAQKAASDANNQAAIQELAKIDPAYQTGDWYDQLMCERKWLLAFGGVYHTTSSYNHEVWMLLKAQEYSFVDFAFWPFSSNRSLQTMYPELMHLNFFESVPNVGVPVYFLVGRHDYNAPFELTAAYYEYLQAPQGKQFIWFDDSAHDLFFDQPDALVRELIKIKGE